MKKKIFIAIPLLLLIIQLFRIDQTNPPVEFEKDIITITKADDKIVTMLKEACYDCHSNETKYPWYSNIAPISWLVADHRNEARHHLNFSIWGEYSQKRKDHKLEECIEMVQEGEMPMDSYTWFHPEAKLTEDQKQFLLEWFMREMR